jgi:hypothetical protein
MRATLQSGLSPLRAVTRMRIGIPWTGPMRAPVRDDFFRDARRKRHVIRVIDVLLLIAVLSVTYAIVRLRNPSPHQTSGSNGVATTTAVATVAQAEKWMAANLSTRARIGVDSAVGHDLTNARRPNIDVLSGGGTGWPADRYVLATPELRSEATANPAISGALGSSRPVAVFGSGTVRVEVRQVAADGPGALALRWSQDVTDRTVGGTGLLRNPRVHVVQASRAGLRRGGLDLRAVVLVGMLAANTDLRIADIASDRAEADAGMPARRLRIWMANPGRWLAPTLATMPPAYRPSSMDVLPDGVRELEWPIALAPVPSLS